MVTSVLVSKHTSAEVNGRFYEVPDYGTVSEAIIHNAIIITTLRPILIVDPQKSLVAHSSSATSGYVKDLSKHKFPDSIYLKGDHIAAFNPGSGKNYFHWLYQCFTGALYYEHKYPEKDFSSVLVTNGSKFFGQYLEKLRTAPFELPKQQMIMIERLHWSSYLTGQFSYKNNSDGVNLLRTIAKPSAPRKRIYISRGDAPKRRVHNEQECIEALKPYGFENYELSKLSVDDQIKLFGEAEFIVAPHGAGLTNIVYCNEFCHVIELIQDNYQNPCFKCIAESTGLNYTAIINPTVTAGGDKHKDSVDVDIPLLIETVSQLVS